MQLGLSMSLEKRIRCKSVAEESFVAHDQQWQEVTSIANFF